MMIKRYERQPQTKSAPNLLWYSMTPPHNNSGIHDLLSQNENAYQQVSKIYTTGEID
jgi:hypothetical protein